MPLRRHQSTPTETPGRRSPSRYTLALLTILVLAAGLRFIGLDWDDGYYLHPDERFMVMVTVDTAWPESVSQYFDSETSPLNPYNTRHGTFVYGTFPLFLTKALSGLFGTDTYGQAHLVGRALSALADTGTVFLVAWIARRFFGNAAGLLAGFLIACTMLHIQSAHFYTVDAMSVFFATATFVAVVKGWDRRSIGWYAIAGLMIGLAGASKPNYLIALGFLALPVLETIRLHGIDGLIPSSRRRLFPVVPAVIVAGLVAFWTFRLGQPYAFTGPNIWNIGLNRQWVDDLSYWSSAQSGLIDIKSSVQWVGRTPIVYIIENMILWGMGPFLGIASLAALGLGIWRLVRARNWPSWWWTGVIGWSVIQLVLYGTNIAQAQRYLLPIYPFLIAGAAGLLVELGRYIDRRSMPALQSRTHGARLRRLPVGNILIAVTVAYTAFYAVAFDSLYVRPLSRVQASEWIYENIPAGSTLTHEYWDDSLPMPLEGEDMWAYNVITLDLYGWEGEESTKLSKIIGQLNQADYIILSSNRIIDSVPRQPERYPMATHYYEMLLDGSLGFDLVAEFTQTPELFGIRFDDTNAEETITVYEHPQVRIFQKTERFDLQAVYAELDTAMGYGGINYLPGDPVGDQMFLTEEEQTTYDEAGTWSDIYDGGSLANRAPTVAWYLGMLFMALPAIPLAWRLFGVFPDRGYALARALGLLVVTWMTWFASSLTPLSFTRWSILLCWAIVAIAGVLAVRSRWSEFLADMRGRWRWIAGTEAIFLIAFAAMAWLRCHNAAFWTPGGTDNTPWYLALFNAAARSESFPSYDTWLSGGQVHTPMWATIPWVLLSRLTGVVPNVAYTLAFAGIFALLCVAVWSVATAIIARMNLTRVPAGWTALLAPLLVCAAGTLNIASRAGQGMWNYPARPSDWPIGGPIGDILYGLGNLITRTPQLTSTFLTEATQVGATGIFTTPFASLLIGNLDPGTATLPIIALATAVAAAIALRDRCSERHDAIDHTGVALLLAGGLLTGMMAASATWGLLLTGAIMLIAIVIRAFGMHSIERSWLLTRQIALQALLLLATATIAALPFSSEFVRTQRNITSGPLVALEDLFLLIGGFILLIGIYVVTGAWRVIRDARSEGMAGQTTAIGAALLAILGLAAGVILDSALLFLLMALLFIAIALWHRQHQPAHILILGFAGLGALILLYAPLAPMPQDPMGTTTAVEMSGMVWLLLGLTATVIIVWLLHRLFEGDSVIRTAGGTLATVGLVGLVVVMIAGPALAARSLTNSAAERALDATAFLATSTDPSTSGADLSAIDWLTENVEGLPVLLEAPGWDHQYGGRISATTGLPAVIGWSGPERLTRPGWEQVITQRQDAANRIYSSTGGFSGIEPLLIQYDVELIYIGQLERQAYSPLALQKFEEAASSGELQVIYEQDGVTIYEYQGGVG